MSEPSVSELLVRCQVWIADIAWRRPDHVDLLDEPEMTRVEKFRRPDDRARFVTAAALLRLVVAAELTAHPKDVTVDRSCPRCGQPHGKPRIPGSDLHVSLSHSGNLVALALAQVAPVGIDLEAKTARGLDAVANTVLSPLEVLAEPDDFYIHWCRKEAVVKATGDGLRVPLVDVVVGNARRPPRLLSYQGTSLDCALGDLDLGPDYAGAVAVLAVGDLCLERQDAQAVLAKRSTV